MDEIDDKFVVVMKKLKRIMKNDERNAEIAENKDGIKRRFHSKDVDLDNGNGNRNKWIDEMEELMFYLNDIKKGYDEFKKELEELDKDLLKPPSEMTADDDIYKSSAEAEAEAKATDAILKELGIRDKIINSLKQSIQNEIAKKLGIDMNDDGTSASNSNSNSYSSSASMNTSNYEAMIETYCLVVETKPFI